jgi:hypothetical protein
VDVRRHPRGRLVLRHDAFDMGEPAANGWGATGAGDGLLSLDEALAELRDAGKGVTIDVKEAGILDEVLAAVARSGVRDEDLWLNGRMDVLGEDGVRAIRATHPGATVQCPIDFIAPLATAMPNEALGLLRTLTGWGVAARMTNVRGANTEGCHKRPSGISMLLAWIEMWPPPCISMFSFSCPTSTRLIGWLGAPQRAQTTDSRRSPDALIATSLSPARTRMDRTPASQSTISRRIDDPCRSTGGD